jgi:hypothetical protein
MDAFYNPDDEDHRNWAENFGFLDSDNLYDNGQDGFEGEKKVPVVEVSVPACSFQETYPEWWNPVTAEELGEQTVTINCEAHIGLYYFETRTEYEDWISNTLNTLAVQVDDPDGEENRLPISLLPDRPTWITKDET